MCCVDEGFEFVFDCFVVFVSFFVGFVVFDL